MRTIYSLLFTGLFLLITTISFTQEIHGKVIAEGGFAASAVTVKFKDKNNAVVTKPDGSFKIIAKKLPDTLYFSGIGFEPYKVAITEETLKDPSFEIVLLNTRKSLSEVVVTTAFSKNRKSKELGYSTSTVSSGYADLSKAIPKGKLEYALEGKVAGLTVYEHDASGAPIRIRGSSSFKSGEAIVLGSKKIGVTDTTIYDKAAPYANTLTAGEVNDFYKWKMWEDFTESEFKLWSDVWKINPKKRITVQLVNSNHSPAIGEKVELIDESTGRIVWTAITDNTGKAELWGDIDAKNTEQKLKIVAGSAKEIKNPGFFENGINTMQVNKPCFVSDKVDIAFVVDATGSMNDEIEFLKLELEDVIRKTFEQYKDLNLNVGSVFYRDTRDEYLTKHIELKNDLLKVLNFVKLQSSGGGGDYPEAVDRALNVAIDSLQWREDARSRILFLIMDAPPHDDAEEEMMKLIAKAAAKGIRIVPIACSGTNKSTEYLMRCIALATNGTYLFLTDNSGVGLPHIKPTTDTYDVELLNSLMQRVIKQMISAPACADSKTEQPVFVKTENTEKVKIYPNPTSGNFKIESSKALKEIYIADFNGKILQRLSVNDKDRIWNVNIGTYANSTYLVKYITNDNKWGAEKVVLIH
jgi:von Willebrand factor type A domain/CarboxypepD_reg-like domain/Secretion system C-terminal sorting domain